MNALIWEAVGQMMAGGCELTGENDDDTDSEDESFPDTADAHTPPHSPTGANPDQPTPTLQPGSITYPKYVVDTNPERGPTQFQ